MTEDKNILIKLAQAIKQYLADLFTQEQEIKKEADKIVEETIKEEDAKKIEELKNIINQQ